MRSPSFKGLVSSSSLSSMIKKKNRAKDTAHEVLLRRLLWRRGLRFRKHVARLPGKPDIVFPRYMLAIFCDGDFWHGRDWKRQSEQLSKGSNPDYWTQKVLANRERDIRNNSTLLALGWTVLRFWETDIRRSPEATVDVIEQKLKEIGSSMGKAASRIPNS